MTFLVKNQAVMARSAQDMSMLAYIIVYELPWCSFVKVSG